MIVVRIWEGLGNQLFQYAYARALQLRTGEKVYIDNRRCFSKELEGHRIRRQYELDNFNIKILPLNNVEKIFPFLENRTYIQKIIYFISQKKIAYIHFYREESVEYKEDLKWLRGNRYIMGWFQNEKYFNDFKTIILRDISPKKKIKLSRKIKKIIDEENTVSIHVRRGDFKSNNNILPIEYYVKAIQIMQNSINNPYYIIFTDDVEWVKKNLTIVEKYMFISNEHLKDYEELLVMSKCKNNIIANSTFSWWGAWLNQNEKKIVIGPEKWFLCGKNRMINIMPDDWIKVRI